MLSERPLRYGNNPHQRPASFAAPPGRPIGLRIDVRDYVNGKPNFLDLANLEGRTHNVEYTAGVSLLF